MVQKRDISTCQTLFRAKNVGSPRFESLIPQKKTKKNKGARQRGSRMAFRLMHTQIGWARICVPAPRGL